MNYYQKVPSVNTAFVYISDDAIIFYLIWFIVANVIFDLMTMIKWFQVQNEFDSLMLHIFPYSCMMYIAVGMTQQFTQQDICRFVLINSAIHTFLDAICLNIMEDVKKSKDGNLFIKTMALDQLAHVITIVGLAYFLLLRQ